MNAAADANRTGGAATIVRAAVHGRRNGFSPVNSYDVSNF